MRIEVSSGQAADRLLSEPAFIAAWRALHAACEHATGFQDPGFVCPWYAAYRAQWEPLIVRGFGDASTELAGLWLLARDASGKVLVQAGAHQAEYHVWVTLPGEALAFVAAAWPALLRHSRVRALGLKYLPSAALADELARTPGIGTHVTVKRFPRPLVRLDATEIKVSFAKKSNKSRFNRLRKLGALEFRRLRDPADLERVFDSLIGYYDFRQGAVNNSTPFRDDPCKRPFHVALFAGAPELAHVTIVSLAGQPISVVWGIRSGDLLHLGMLAYSPLLGEHSPGKLHVMQLSQALIDDGIGVLDLTPGGDPWKERFANAHDDVAELTLYRSPARRYCVQIADRALAAAKISLAGYGLSPARLRAVAAVARRARPGKVVHKARAWLSESREFRVYRLTRDTAGACAPDARVELNSIAALLTFEPGEAWQSRELYLSSALARLENGDSVFTISSEGRLAHSLWMARSQPQSFLTEVQQTVEFPPGSVLMYDAYTHPDFRGRGYYRATLAHTLHHAFAEPSAECVYACVLANNVPSRKVIEALKFQYQGSLYWRNRCGTHTKWASPAFSLAPTGHA